jgi:Ca2+/Na+ antiporter
MVLPIILVILVIIALALYYWYITLPIIIAIVLLWKYSTRNSNKKEEEQSRRSQSSSYQNDSQSNYSNSSTDGYGQSYQRQSYQRQSYQKKSYQKKSYQRQSYQEKIDEKKSYHYEGYEYKKIGKPKLARINERLEKFQITTEEARIIFGNAWTTKLGIKDRTIFYFMIRRIEIRLQYDYNDRNKNKFRHLYSKVLEIIQTVMDENEDLREKEKRWSEGDYSHDYDYQNFNDDSEITEKKITQSFQIFGLTRNSTIEQIKSKYRELSLKFHPDRNKNTDTTTKMSEINSAYKIIMGAIA